MVKKENYSLGIIICVLLVTLNVARIIFAIFYPFDITEIINLFFSFIGIIITFYFIKRTRKQGHEKFLQYLILILLMVYFLQNLFIIFSFV